MAGDGSGPRRFSAPLGAAKSDNDWRCSSHQFRIDTVYDEQKGIGVDDAFSRDQIGEGLARDEALDVAEHTHSHRDAGFHRGAAKMR